MIGQLVARIGSSANRITSWHRVESEIEDRVVLRCGKQMRLETARGELSFADATTGPLCHYCRGPQ